MLVNILSNDLICNQVITGEDKWWYVMTGNARLYYNVMKIEDVELIFIGCLLIFYLII